MPKGFEKWGKLPLIYQFISVESRARKNCSRQHVKCISPDQIGQVEDTVDEFYTVVDGELFLYMGDATREVKVTYTTIHQKTLKRPRKKR